MGQERTYLDMYYSKETWEGEPPEWEEGVKTHPISCRSYISRGMGFLDLLPEHGYFDYHRNAYHGSGDKIPIVWFRPGFTEGVKLPLKVHPYLNSSIVRFESFLNSYVLDATPLAVPREGLVTSPSENSDAYSIWLFVADGKISSINVPYRGWMRGGGEEFLPCTRRRFHLDSRLGAA